MGTPALRVTILGITDDATGSAMVRPRRWPSGVRCPHCGSAQVVKQGRDETEPQRPRSECRAGGRRFDDLTDTIFAGPHPPLRAGVRVRYVLGLNLAHVQIAKELDLDPDDAPRRATRLREGVVPRKPLVTLSGVVECERSTSWRAPRGLPRRSEKGREGRRRRQKGAPGRRTRAKEKPPIVGLIPRTGAIGIRMRADVPPKTLGPLITETSAPGRVVSTDESDISHHLPTWGDTHRTVCPAAGEFARDDDGDGFYAGPVTTREGFWSLLRSGRRPPRGVSQEKLPLSLGFFEFVPSVRRRGKARLGALIGLLLKPSPRNAG